MKSDQKPLVYGRVHEPSSSQPGNLTELFVQGLPCQCLEVSSLSLPSLYCEVCVSLTWTVL